MSLNHLYPAQDFSPVLSALFSCLFSQGSPHFCVEAAASNMLTAKTKMTFSHFSQNSKEVYSQTPLLNICHQ